ncbi:Calponin homology domain-containing protein [Strongyloides ratti]|uniref:Calponin homology domain-containing protein n=1 Tax=Strongyloides ratti TaxID=34506 RepID=A0A090L8F2_STRRB|nr:Calponin homology domain-containing protein [Strongyloides ratti]CEF64408.1 Calponin homology domain-containing protein [Strongyloides ratti]
MFGSNSSRGSSVSNTPKNSRVNSLYKGGSPISTKRRVLTETRNGISKTPSCTERRKQYSQDLQKRIIRSVVVKKTDKENEHREVHEIDNLCNKLNLIEKSHRTATEELQATAEELHDLKEIIGIYEKELIDLQNENERLRHEVSEKEGNEMLDESQYNDENLFYYKNMYQEQYEENKRLKQTIRHLKDSLKREKEKSKQFGADMLVVIKAADRMREEAEAELAKVLNRKLSFNDKRRKSEIEESRDFIVASHLAKIDAFNRDSVSSSISDCVFDEILPDGKSLSLQQSSEKLRKPRSSFTPHKVAGVIVTNPAEESMWNDLLKNKKLMSRRNALLACCHELLSDYVKIEDLTNFSSCWSSGKAFAYLLLVLVDDGSKLTYTINDIKFKLVDNLIGEVLKSCKKLGMNDDMLEKEEELSKDFPEWKKVMRFVVNIIVFLKYSHNN